MNGKKSMYLTHGYYIWPMLRNNYKPRMAKLAYEVMMNKLDKEFRIFGNNDSILWEAGFHPDFIEEHIPWILINARAVVNNLDRSEEATAIYASYGWVCQNCGKSVFVYGTPQLAHKIANTKSNRKKYGSAVIDHPLNRKPTCSLYCNSKMNIAGNLGKCKELINQIIEGER